MIDRLFEQPIITLNILLDCKNDSLIDCLLLTLVCMFSGLCKDEGSSAAAAAEYNLTLLKDKPVNGAKHRPEGYPAFNPVKMQEPRPGELGFRAVDAGYPGDTQRIQLKDHFMSNLSAPMPDLSNIINRSAMPNLSAPMPDLSKLTDPESQRRPGDAECYQRTGDPDTYERPGNPESYRRLVEPEHYRRPGEEQEEESRPASSSSSQGEQITIVPDIVDMSDNYANIEENQRGEGEEEEERREPGQPTFLSVKSIAVDPALSRYIVVNILVW